jgi:hypothetical protein
MPALLHTLHCPLGFDLDLVVDLGMTQAEYLAGLEAKEYRAVVGFPNWSDVMGDRPKPVFPLTDETIGELPFALVRYISSGAVIGDALDDLMETRNPNSKGRS